MVKKFTIQRICDQPKWFEYWTQRLLILPTTSHTNPQNVVQKFFIQAAADSRILRDVIRDKESESSQGKGVFGQGHQDCLDQINKMSDDIIVQEFCEMEQPIYDIRMMMVGTELVGAMKRVLHSDDPLEFRSNLSLGNSVAERYIPSLELIASAQRIQQKSLLDWVGIDVISYRNHFIPRGNTSPGLKGISEVCPNIVEEVLSLLEGHKKLDIVFFRQLDSFLPQKFTCFFVVVERLQSKGFKPLIARLCQVHETLQIEHLLCTCKIKYP